MRASRKRRAFSIAGPAFAASASSAATSASDASRSLAPEGREAPDRRVVALAERHDEPARDPVARILAARRGAVAVGDLDRRRVGARRGPRDRMLRDLLGRHPEGRDDGALVLLRDDDQRRVHDRQLGRGLERARENRVEVDAGADRRELARAARLVAGALELAGEVAEHLLEAVVRGLEELLELAALLPPAAGDEEDDESARAATPPTAAAMADTATIQAVLSRKSITVLRSHPG